MLNHRGLFLVLVLTACLAFFVGCTGLRKKFVLDRMNNVAEQNLGTSILDGLPDGLHVVLCGAGSPMPDPVRAGPCTAVIAGNRVFIVDAGAGSTRRLALYRVPLDQVNAVFLTHFHSDHIDDLGGLLLQRWANGAGAPVPIHGPSGVEEVVAGFNRAYRQDSAYRVAHHGPDIMITDAAGGIAKPFTTPTKGNAITLIETDDLVISSFGNDHNPVEASVGYRFDYKGRSLVISGDTKKSENVQKFAADADLLVHEALNREMVDALMHAATKAERPRIAKIMYDIDDYHTSPSEAAEIARDARVRHLLFTHIVPPLPYSAMDSVFADGVADIFEGPHTVGRDGMMVSLEAYGENIEVTSLDGAM